MITYEFIYNLCYLSKIVHLKIPQNVTKFYKSTLNKYIEKLRKLLHELKAIELVFLFPEEQI